MKTGKNVSSNAKRSNLHGYLFLGPWLLGFIVFTVLPIIYTLYLSFFNVHQTGLGYRLTWVGIRNYRYAFLESLDFLPALFNFSIMQLLYVPVILVISFILGLLLNQKIRMRGLFRVIFFLPVIILSGSVLQQFMDTGATALAPISNLLVFWIIASYSFLLARGLEILFLNFTMVLWFTGIPIILFINAFQKIDRSMYEAAQIDGANGWQALWKITVPLSVSTALVVSIYSIVNLGLFSINPMGDGRVSLYQLIRNAMSDTTSGLGNASAFAVIYTLAVLLLIACVLLIFRESKSAARAERLRIRKLKQVHRSQKRDRLQNLTVKEFVNSHRKAKRGDFDVS